MAKYASNPIQYDIEEYNCAQAWGSIVAGYFLLEQSLKALLHLCNCQIGRTHVLYSLFELLPDKQKNILRFHYSDFVKAFPGLGRNTLDEIDGFFQNLDGDQSKGSFDWRYFLIEEQSSSKLPFIEMGLIYENVYSICRALEVYGNADDMHEEYTYSTYLACARRRVFLRWYEQREYSPDWAGTGDRIEIFWGPDYAARYSYVKINGDQLNSYFDILSEDLENKFSICDVRAKFMSFQESDDLWAQFVGKTHRHLMF